MLQRCMSSRSPPPSTTPTWGVPLEYDSSVGDRSCGNSRCSNGLYGSSETTDGTVDGDAAIDGSAAGDSAAGDSAPGGSAVATSGSGGAFGPGAATSSSVQSQPSRLRNRIVPCAARAPSTAYGASVTGWPSTSSW